VPCDDGGNRCVANTSEQVFGFVFVQVGPGSGRNHIGDVYEIRTTNDECWDIQGGRSDAGVDAIRWACHQQSNQRFRLRFIAPLDLPASRTFARQVGW
jgi:hypothetical protein